MAIKDLGKNDNLGKNRTLIFSKEVSIKDPTIGVLMPQQISFIEFKDAEPDGTVSTILSMERFTQAQAEKQLQLIELKHNCIRVAELLNEQLRRFLLQYNKDKNLPTDHLYSDNFMKIREYLSEIVNKDKMSKYIDEIGNNLKRRNFTKNFFSLIEDRNIYTHGHLHIRINDMTGVITYVDKKNNRDSFCTVDESIFQ